MKDYAKFESRDPHPKVPFEQDEQSWAGVAAIIMLMVALLLWFFP